MMLRRTTALGLALALTTFAACDDEGGSPSADVTQDAADDASEDAAQDVGDDAQDDATQDATGDAGQDTATPDATEDAADAGPDVDDVAEPDAIEDTNGDAVEDVGDDIGDDVSQDVEGDTGEPAGWTGNTECQNGERIGKFEVAHFDFYGWVSGEVASGVIPLTVLQPVAEEGPCRLMRKENPFCDPPCAGGQLCDHDGSCVPYPANQSVGEVTVSGLAQPVTMTPTVTKTYSNSSLPFPMTTAGAEITLTAAGGDLPGFTLKAYGVPMLALPDETLTLKKGQAMPVTWTASDGPGSVYMTLNIDQHGNSPALLVCEVEDTGAYTIPASMVTALMDSGVSGFTTFNVYRRTVDAVELAAGCVELQVFSNLTGKVQVEGHVPCVKDLDCPEGQTCDLPINTCVGD